MANPVLVDVADALVWELKTKPFFLAFTCERSYADWELPLEEGDDALRLDVVPVGTMPADLDTREGSEYRPACDVVVRKRMLPEDYVPETKRLSLAKVDELVRLVEDIHDFLCAERLSKLPEGVWQESKILAAYKPSHLRQHHQFTGIVRVTYAIDKSLA